MKFSTLSKIGAVALLLFSGLFFCGVSAMTRVAVSTHSASDLRMDPVSHYIMKIWYLPQNFFADVFLMVSALSFLGAMILMATAGMRLIKRYAHWKSEL